MYWYIWKPPYDIKNKWEAVKEGVPVIFIMREGMMQDIDMYCRILSRIDHKMCSE